MRTIVVVFHLPIQDPLKLQEVEERMQEERRGKWRERKMGGEVALLSVLANKMRGTERIEALSTSNFKSSWKHFTPASKIIHFDYIAGYILPLRDPVDIGQNKECFIPNISLFILWIKWLSFIQFTRLQ